MSTHQPDWGIPTAVRCADYVRQLDDVIASLTARGLRESCFQRLRAGRTLLSRVAAEGRYPSDPERLRLIGHALRDAHEFFLIHDCLPHKRIDVVERELEHALGGALGQRGGNRKPFQYQSQLWVGAVLASTGINPLVVMDDDNRTKLDYYLDNGTRRYGIEVKRPETEESAARAVVKAARQLRNTRTYGAVVIDASDCFEPNASATPTLGAESGLNAWDAAVNRFAHSLCSDLFEKSRPRIRSKFDFVIGLIIVAKALGWDLGDLTAPHLLSKGWYFTLTRNSPNTLLSHHARWICNVFSRGMNAAGYATLDSGSS